jgi:cytochrome c peroxidase
MRRLFLISLVSGTVGAGALLAGLDSASFPAQATAAGMEAAKLASDAKAAGLAPLPSLPSVSDPAAQARVTLGRRLFYENRVSQDGNVSCSHCHQADLAASDGLPKSIGVFGKANPRNAPSIFNATLQFKQHWRGDRESLEDQAEKSLLGPASFGNPDYSVPMAALKAIPGYAAAFAAAFPGDKDPVTSKNWGAAIGAFERRLLTPGRFDAFLAGDEKALSATEQAGLRKFVDLGCVACHNGPGLGGTSFQKFGVVEDYWKETGSASPDKGRADVTKNDADLYVFKVPALRNVAKTGPYFHDGSVPDLPRAVRIMAKVQLGKDLSQRESADILAFLASLTGAVPAEFVPLEPFPGAPAGK